MARGNYRKGQIPYDFIALPKAVVTSAEWYALPPAAQVLALHLASQYTGKNNGRLTPAFEAMQRCGWTSKTTLISAKRSLLNASFIMLTRKGHAPRTAEWIGFTWWKLDWQDSMDIGKNGWPYLNFVSIEMARIDPNKGRTKPGFKNTS
ncbi:MAG: hypothetical protein KGL43_04935 [Burkholderiales bacterium]|nr:hypothetical protein [Burkholderiales bacterium]